MIGTLFNTCMILVGSIVGSLLKKGLKEKQQRVLFDAMGLAAAGIGINAIVNNMPDSQYPVLFIVSLAVGSIIGTSLDIDAKFQHIVDARGGSGLGQGLSTAILLFCIGTLSILGPIQSAIYDDETFLFTNGTLDLVTSMVLASTYGIGIAIAAVVLFSVARRHLSGRKLSDRIYLRSLYDRAFDRRRLSDRRIRHLDPQDQGLQDDESAAVPAGPCDLFLRKKSDRLTATRSTRTLRRRQPSKVPQLQSKG